MANNEWPTKRDKVLYDIGEGVTEGVSPDAMEQRIQAAAGQGVDRKAAVRYGLGIAALLGVIYYFN